jgi:glycerate 2-kinase
VSWPAGSPGPARSRSWGHVVIAPDKFKGSLDAADVAAAIEAGVHRFDPDRVTRTTVVADGGEGTLAALTAHGFTPSTVTVSGPTGEPVRAAFGIRGDQAVVELAQASGLGRLPAGPDPLGATSRGTGELIRAALDAGCRQIILGLGGSAGTDGGAGMLEALGARLIFSPSPSSRVGGAALRSVRALDLTGLDHRLAGAEILLAGDVDNPLLGPDGAAAVYAPQKGADPAQVALLEEGLATWAEVVADATGHHLAERPGAGAAGGVGFGALAVLGARIRPGIDLVLELCGFERIVAGAALVITGEGSLDRQSLNGKAPVGVAKAAARSGVATVAVAGVVTLSPQDVDRAGLLGAFPLTDLEPDPRRCIAEAARLLEKLVATTVAPLFL